MNFVRHLLIGFLGSALVAVAAAQAEPTGRFSQDITAGARNSTGLTRLNADETAILDALVRRDAADAAAQRSAATSFSQRLSVDEYRHAGLGHLTAAELVNLDALVAAHETVPVDTPLVAGRLTDTSTAAISYTPAKRELHGEVFVEFGGGRGFSERAGGIALTVEDPARHMALSFGYAERRLDCH